MFVCYFHGRGASQIDWIFGESSFTATVSPDDTKRHCRQIGEMGHGISMTSSLENDMDVNTTSGLHLTVVDADVEVTATFGLVLL